MAALKLVMIASVLILSGPAWAQDDPNPGSGAATPPQSPTTCPEVIIPECKPGEVTVRETFQPEGSTINCHRYSPCHDQWNPPPPPLPDPCEDCPAECVTPLKQKLQACLDYAGEDYDPDAEEAP